MKYSKSILIRAGIILGLAVILFLTLGLDSSVRSGDTCTAVDIAVRDSSSTKVVTDDEVSRILMRRGYAEGTPLDSIDLFRIEQILAEESCVKYSEAFMTPDGVLHLEIDQRKPVVRFITPEGGFYLDKEGYVIPLGDRYVARVPVIRGALNFSFDSTRPGHPGEPKDSALLVSYASMISDISADPYWSGSIADIVIDSEYGLVVYPIEGKEFYIWGTPELSADKLDKMTRYLTAIVPLKGENYYKSVDLRYRKQIICKK